MRKRLIGIGAAAVAILSPLVVAGPAQAVTTTTGRATDTSVSKPMDTCDYRVTVTGNGVRIHNAPSTLATVVGLAYRGYTYEDWGHIVGWYDLGSSRWISDQYAYASAYCY